LKTASVYSTLADGALALRFPLAPIAVTWDPVPELIRGPGIELNARETKSGSVVGAGSLAPRPGPRCLPLWTGRESLIDTLSMSLSFPGQRTARGRNLRLQLTRPWALTVDVPSYYFVRLVNAENEAPVISYFVPGRQPLVTAVPTGVFILKRKINRNLGVTSLSKRRSSNEKLRPWIVKRAGEQARKVAGFRSACIRGENQTASTPTS
jgi:hypothetical protein